MILNVEDVNLLDEMSDIELLLKYRNYAGATDRLQRLMLEHPDYLPAKQALCEVYRMTKQVKRAADLQKEIHALSEDRAKMQLSQPAREELAKIEKRQFAEKVDALVKIVYQGSSIEDTFESTSAELLEILKADRCLLMWSEEAREKGQEDLECCAKDVQSCLSPDTANMLSRWFAENPRFETPLISENAQADPALAVFRNCLQQHQIHALMGYPLIYRSTLLGWLVVQQCVRGYSWNESERTLFSVACGHIATAFSNLRSLSELQDLAFKDPLTGLYNRHFLKERLTVELTNAQRLNYPLSLSLIDADHFKRINDSYGHPVGDAVLRKLAFLLKTKVRQGSVVARWGGEEFLVVFPKMDLQSVALMMDRFREMVSHTIRVETQSVTISVGLSQANFESGRSLEEVQSALIQEADERLYQSKRNGRNQVSFTITPSSSGIATGALKSPGPCGSAALNLPF